MNNASHMFIQFRHVAAAGKAPVGRQKQAQDFSSFLRNASTQEPRRQATSFSSFIRQGVLLHIACNRIAALEYTAQLLAEAWPSRHNGWHARLVHSCALSTCSLACA